MASLEEEYKKYKGEGYDQVNSMYDAQRQAALSGLESAYNQNLSNAQAARDALPEQYQARANDLAVQYERQRRNLNEQAATNGLNTGAGSQMQLALGSNYQRDYGGIRRAEQQAVNEADRGIRDLQSAYQSSVQQAVADNDYRRAQALLGEYKNQYQNALNRAQTLASYGDFSAYLNVPGYSQEQVDAMRSAWVASNPQLAYNTGAITAEDYYRMTGKWPAGYAPAGSNAYTPGSSDTGGKKYKTSDLLKNAGTSQELRSGVKIPDDAMTIARYAGLYGTLVSQGADPAQAEAFARSETGYTGQAALAEPRKLPDMREQMWREK